MGLFSKETLALKVDGMTCGNCVAHVTKALEAVAGVKKVEVALDQGHATVVTSGSVARSVLVAAVQRAGYDAE